MEDCLRPRIDTSLKAALKTDTLLASFLVLLALFVLAPEAFLPDAILLGVAIDFRLFSEKQLLEIHSAVFLGRHPVVTFLVANDPVVAQRKPLRV
jgi:hypothetical protein